MGRLIEGISYDAKFIRDHKLQPGWFKILKVFILVGAAVAYTLFFGWKKATVFVAVFLLLSLVVHYTYRAKTERFTRSWLDFRVREEGGKVVADRIGGFYYLAIVGNATIALTASQLVPA
jgi:membrane protein implicated in regulation of membrane protease activity